MKAIKILIISTLTVLSFNTFGQLDLSYTAEKMDTSINSTYSEVAPVFSHDGNRMYFVRINHPDNRFGIKGSQDIWYSEKVDAKWSSAVRLPNSVNLGRYNALYAVTKSGGLIVNGVYDYKDDFLKRGLSIITPKEDSLEYNYPIPLRIKKYARKSDGSIASVSFDDEYTKMFMSFSKRRYGNKNQIYLSLRDEEKGKWSKPKRIKSVKSSKSNEAPFFSHEGDVLYFASNRDNSKKNFDIYSSSLIDSVEFKKWSEPVKVLGDVSKDDYESFFVLDPKGEYAYFSSVRDSEGKADIYKLQVKDVRKYILLKGFVVNDKSGKKMPNGPFSLKVLSENQEIKVDDFILKEDSSFFQFKLPFGSKYKMIAGVEDFKESPVDIDLSSIDSYQEMNLDAKVSPIPVLDLSGKVNFVDFDPEIMSYDSVEIYADGNPVEGVVVNSDGSYNLSLPTGKIYKIDARKKGNVSFPVDVDVTNDDSKISKTMDLKLERIPDIYSYLKTNVKSRKDSSFLKRSDYMVYIDGQPAPYGYVIKTDQGFDMTLEMGKKYFIMVKSDSHIEAHDSVDFRNAKVRQTIKKDFYLVPIEVGATVQIENIYFDLGKSTLRPESYIELNRLVEMLGELENLVIEVSGHTDNKGNADLNKRLSGERALSVRKYLIEKGVSEDRMTSKGYGFDKPIAPNDTEENRAINRRVEFTILSNDK